MATRRPRGRGEPHEVRPETQAQRFRRMDVGIPLSERSKLGNSAHRGLTAGRVSRGRVVAHDESLPASERRHEVSIVVARELDGGLVRHYAFRVLTGSVVPRSDCQKPPLAGWLSLFKGLARHFVTASKWKLGLGGGRG